LTGAARLAQTAAVLSWGELEAAEPALAAAGRSLLYQFGVGLAFLATVRRDGAPRLHPVCPLFHDAAMFAFSVPGPKQDDLRRDGRYALHSFPCPDSEDAFSCSGRAELVTGDALRHPLAKLFAAERADLGVPVPAAADRLFRFRLDRALLTRTTGHGDPAPRHTVWRRPAG
jgi:hypothetical protein